MGIEQPECALSRSGRSKDWLRITWGWGSGVLAHLWGHALPLGPEPPPLPEPLVILGAFSYHLVSH